MSLAWKQEFGLASESDQIDWAALLHAFSHPENASAPQASQGLSVFSLSDDGAPLWTQAAAFDWLAQVLDLGTSTPGSPLDGLLDLETAGVAELASGVTAGPAADAAGDAPVSGEVTAEFKEMLAASWPAVQQMLQEAVFAAFPETQFKAPHGAPALIADFVSADVTPLTPASDFPG